MRELSFSELKLVSGGSSLADSVAIGTGAGATISIITHNTAAGATRGGAVGAALGFAFGVGYATGTWLYNTFS